MKAKQRIAAATAAWIGVHDDRLTKREADVVRALMKHPKSIKEVASALEVSADHVRQMSNGIYKKFGYGSRIELTFAILEYM